MQNHTRRPQSQKVKKYFQVDSLQVNLGEPHRLDSQAIVQFDLVCKQLGMWLWFSREYLRPPQMVGSQSSPRQLIRAKTQKGCCEFLEGIRLVDSLAKPHFQQPPDRVSRVAFHPLQILQITQSPRSTKHRT